MVHLGEKFTGTYILCKYKEAAVSNCLDVGSCSQIGWLHCKVKAHYKAGWLWHFKPLQTARVLKKMQHVRPAGHSWAPLDY